MVLAWEALAQVIPDLYIGVLASFRCCQMTDPRAAQTARAMLSHSMSWRGSLRALYQRMHTCIIQRLAQTCWLA
jgi:hypothetical protein